MLPDCLSSSYDAYKKDTGILLEWLSQASAKCGYVAEASAKTPSKRLKGKQRAKAKAAVTGEEDFNAFLAQLLTT